MYSLQPCSIEGRVVQLLPGELKCVLVNWALITNIFTTTVNRRRKCFENVFCNDLRSKICWSVRLEC